MRYAGTVGARGRWKYFVGIPVSLLLLLSTVPSSFADIDFKRFAGDYLDVPNSQELQLSQFTLEVKFRILQDPLERGYLVSKGASDGENPLLDQNYAVFISPLKKIGGGFKASDGT